MEIDSLELRQIITSRTNPTVEAEINGDTGKAPAGASTGEHEVNCTVPDDLDATEQELQQLEGEDLTQQEFDQKLQEIDGTEKFENIGAASIASSFAFKKAAGYSHSNKFPYPASNIVGGGEHGGNTAIQEFLIIPVEAETFPEAIEINTAIYQEMKQEYEDKYHGMNDEGALILDMDDRETLSALKEIADKHGARLGLDVAASEFYNGEKYVLDSMDAEYTPEEMLEFVQDLIEDYNLIYVEDPFDENDFETHRKLVEQEDEALIVGDDLFVTSKDRLQKGIDQGSCNALIVKPNQIGTVSDARETVELAQQNSYVPVVSHRSGETCDPSISDLSLEWEAPILKAGIADIRIAKLNRLTRLWDKQESPEMAEF
ncbi:MAG: enolase C-terminal domain-like protein [Candidatus Nanohaloarchaea archaeon]